LENVFSGQLLQILAPAFEKVPTEHIEHEDDDIDAYWPSRQAAVTAERPVVAQYEPEGHAVHELDPVDA